MKQARHSVLILLFALLWSAPAGAQESPAQDNTQNNANPAVKANTGAEAGASVDVKPRTTGADADSGSSRGDQPDGRAQDGNQESPVDSPVDRAMMNALEEEYENPGRSSSNDPSYPQFDGPVIVQEDEPEEEEWIVLRFELVYWAAELDETEISSRTGDVRSIFNATDIAQFDDDDDDEFSTGSFLYKGSIGLHPVISITGLFYKMGFESKDTLRQNIIFSGQGFAEGDRLKTNIEISATEFNLAVHAIRCDWIRFDIMLGARYQKTVVEYSRVGDGAPPARQRFESLTPIIGLGLTLRLGSWLEVYGTLQGGGIEYDAEDDDDDRFTRGRKIDERGLSIAIIDVGARIKISEACGVGVGLRVEDFEHERYQGREGSNNFETTLGGAYLSVFLGF